jgi:methionyl-tRNA synthetase
MSQQYYVSTPIYYVNDRPHIGHVYTTTVADVVARYQRLRGADVFFLTGTDEHGAKVADAAVARGLTPLQGADENSEAFRSTFARMGMSNDDFLRTTQERHTVRVENFIKQLLDSGDVYQGEYEGWYDAGQEEYVPENKAREADYKSAVNGKPLVKKRERNYFFKLSSYADRLLALLESGEEFDVKPEARKNEVIARIKEGLNDNPITRTGMGDWGIKVPGDPEHTIYVWIDALLNYVSAVDTDERRHYWPADVHFIAKDILWFHTVIWPALLLALRAQEGNEWLRLPRLVYCHSYWIAEGVKMSKSLGNFLEVEQLDRYVEDFSLDALRHFLVTQGPLGANDADFSHARFVEVYNADLANTIGNCFSRISNMTNRYFDGKLPAPGPAVEAGAAYDTAAADALAQLDSAFTSMNVTRAAEAGLSLVRTIDAFIEETRPFSLAKQEDKLPEVGTILYQCAEAMRIASLLLWPILPGKMEEVWRRLGCDAYVEAMADSGRGDLASWAVWGQLEPGTPILQGEPLFPRYKD